ncbi:hypothetical protein [Pseudogracilibacillus sp. SO30301A]|uniref:hypothetical protein n=1 Tax=Pseudogracilibacillus sp. SO30301A TaxID=3098291 RepID=UPI00300E0E0C
MEQKNFRKRRAPFFIKHGVTALIFMSVYYFLDYGLMRLFLLVQLFVFIKDLRMCVYIKEEQLVYRTLFRTRSIPLQEVKRIFLAERRIFGAYGVSVEFNYFVYVKTEDNKTTLLWALPVNVIPKKERYLFEKIIKQKNPAISMNLVKAQFFVG